MHPRLDRLDRLQKILAYRFADAAWLTHAITHKSHGSHNNERLEFLGDAILGQVIAVDLFHRFPEAKEGQLSRLRAAIVKQKTLAELAREFKLGEYLIMGTGALKNGGFKRDSILSDTIEAIIGAIYLDSNHDTANGVVLSWFTPRLSDLAPNHSLLDAKSKLQEYLQARQLNLPEYQIIRTKGDAHKQTFYVQCSCALLAKPVTAEGTSRRIAEQGAAKLALKILAHD